MTRRYLLDTGPAFDCLFRRKGAHQRLLVVRAAGARIGIGMPVLGEIIAGIQASTSRAESWKVVHRSLGQFVLWPYDSRAAYEYGKIFAELKRLGRPMQQIDMMIAAIAKVLGDCTVVTSDSDLSAIPGLITERWGTE